MLIYVGWDTRLILNTPGNDSARGHQPFLNGTSL